MKIDLEKIEPVCGVTRKAIEDFNKMDDVQFRIIYSCSKLEYYERVMKYGDPYMNGPLAKLNKVIRSAQRKQRRNSK